MTDISPILSVQHQLVQREKADLISLERIDVWA